METELTEWLAKYGAQGVFGFVVALLGYVVKTEKARIADMGKRIDSLEKNRVRKTEFEHRLQEISKDIHDLDTKMDQNFQRVESDLKTILEALLKK